jgi:hypothetical protein
MLIDRFTSIAISSLLSLGLMPGCGGANNPPPAPLPDMSSAPCNQLAFPTGNITIAAGSGSLPAATGGTIADGTYLLTSSTDYEAGDALVGQTTAAIMVVASGTIESALIDAKGGANRFNVSYSLSGTTMRQTGTCGFTETMTLGYSAAPSTITLIQTIPPLVSTYSRM